MRGKLSSGFWMTLVIFGLVIAMPDRTRGAPQDVAIIKRMIEWIRTASPTTRQDGAEEMTEKQFAANTLTSFVDNMDPSEREALDPGTIDDIAALLSDQDTRVRYEVAAALGYIGAPAKRAIPALIQALKDAHSYRPKSSVGTGVGIEDVIVFRLIEWEVCKPQPMIDRRHACDYLLP